MYLPFLVLSVLLRSQNISTPTILLVKAWFLFSIVTKKGNARFFFGLVAARLPAEHRRPRGVCPWDPSPDPSHPQDAPPAQLQQLRNVRYRDPAPTPNPHPDPNHNSSTYGPAWEPGYPNPNSKPCLKGPEPCDFV